MTQAQVNYMNMDKNISLLIRGGYYCPFKCCFEKRHCYASLRDHLFSHSVFKAEMNKLDFMYQNCCTSKPNFKSPNHRMMHRFKRCENARKNLDHILAQVIDTMEEYIFDDESSEPEENLPMAPPNSPRDD